MNDPNDDPFQDPAWLNYADHIRKELIPMIKESSITMALVTGSDPDPKQAVELGYMVLLDKPIIACVTAGTKVPNKLAIVADAIVEINLDDPEDTAKRIGEAIKELDLDKPPNPLFKK